MCKQLSNRDAGGAVVQYETKWNKNIKDKKKNFSSAGEKKLPIWRSYEYAFILGTVSTAANNNVT